MKQQVFVIHGGSAYNSYEEYILSLTNKVVSLEDLKRIGWKKTLQEYLGDRYEIFNPQMPSAQNAKYEEWKIYFEKFLLLLNDDVILVGHSLGGIFLAKFFSENKSIKKLKGLFFVAAPYNTKENHPLANFIINDLNLLQAQCQSLYFYHSKDDHVVPYSSMEYFQKVLPNATYRIFENRQHFNQETFPEIIADIKNLA